MARFLSLLFGELLLERLLCLRGELILAGLLCGLALLIGLLDATLSAGLIDRDLFCLFAGLT